MLVIIPNRKIPSVEVNFIEKNVCITDDEKLFGCVLRLSVVNTLKSKQKNLMKLKMSKIKGNPEAKKKFICPECGISLSSTYNLKVHLETRCSTEKNHVS